MREEKRESATAMILAVGDEVQCEHCRNWHVVKLNTNAHAITVTSVQDMLYVFCPKKLATFYVGSIGKPPSRWPMRKRLET